MGTPSSYWTGRVCVVTGGSSGFGLALAEAAARAGARVTLAARNQDRLGEALRRIDAIGGQALAVPADVTHPDDVTRLRDATLECFGQIDMLANCVGISQRGAVLETGIDRYRELMELNFLSVVQTTAALAPSLIQQRGHVVNIGSLASKIAPRYMGAYPASKHALAAYTQQLRLELGDQLHALLVCPGPIASDQTGPRYEAAAGVPESARAPGGGAKIRGIDPGHLAEKILRACERRRPELIVPAKARLLFTIAQASPRLGDWLLSKFTSS